MSLMRVLTWRSGAVFVVVLAWNQTAADSNAQETAADRTAAVRSASFDQAIRPPAPSTIKFGRNTAQVGEQVEQTIWLQMRLATSTRQGNQLVAQQQTVTRGEQRRVVTTTAVDAGRTNAVAVHYLKAVKHVDQSDGSLRGDPNAAPNSSQLSQPVEGKTYHCRRAGGDDDKLIVHDAQGNIPPSAEYEIVAENMETVGRANPLADFLAHRSVAVGDTLELPQQAADRLFNLGERFGVVKRFDLTLRETLVADGMMCAAFTARIEAASNDSSQMRLQVEGPLVVQIDTCRAVRAELSGPLALSESRGTYSTAHQLIGTGNLTMRVASVYSMAPR